MGFRILTFTPKDYLGKPIHYVYDAADSVAQANQFAWAVLKLSLKINAPYLVREPKEPRHQLTINPMGSFDDIKQRITGYRESVRSGIRAYEIEKAIYDRGMNLVKQARTQPVSEVIKDLNTAHIMGRFYKTFLQDSYPSSISYVETWD